MDRGWKRLTVLIAGGTLVPTHDRMTARSENYRYSANAQVIIDVDTRLVVATGDPQPGNLNDCTAYSASGADQATASARVIADGAYRSPGCRGVIIPHRKPAGGGVLLPAARQRLGPRRPGHCAHAQHRRHQLTHPMLPSTRAPIQLRSTP